MEMGECVGEVVWGGMFLNMRKGIIWLFWVEGNRDKWECVWEKWWKGNMCL